MVTPISQVDARWANVNIGKTRLKISRWGCCISACCMALEKLRGSFCFPNEAARFWKFNSKGEILWDTKFNGMTFLKRFFFYDYATIEKYTNDPTKACIIQVNLNRYAGGDHWVFAESADKRKIQIIDPLDGVRKPMPLNYQLTGFSVFEASEVKLPDWADEDWQEGQKTGLPFKDPQQEISLADFQTILKFYGLLNSVDRMPAYRANSAALRWKREIENKI